MFLPISTVGINQRCVNLKSRDQEDITTVQYLTKDMVDKTPEGIVLDTLKLNKMCCRRHMLTHVDIE